MNRSMHAEQIQAQLGAAAIAEIDHEIAHAPYRDAVAIDALKIVQKHQRWVSDDSLRALAGYLDMSAEELEGIATFYNLIFRKPVGDKVILLCNSVSCWIKGCERLQARIGQRLGVDPGETTADGEYTLLPVPCLGACDRAPVLMVEEDVHHDVDDAAVDRLFGARNDAGDRA